MSLISTRGGAAVTASQAILQGLAPNGGLFVPCMFPQITLADIAAMTDDTYLERATRILSTLLDDFTPDDVAQAVQGAYGAGNFDNPFIAPLKTIYPGLHMLELFHGPTLAFKDMALQILPHLTRISAKKCGEEREVFILVATSGDTGKAALDGFTDVPGTRCAVFYPKDGVSEAQRLQMVTQRGENAHVIAVTGNFDDAQTGVKRLFADQAFQDEMQRQGRVLSSANSINYGRLAPQIVYYFSAYADLLKRGAITLGAPVHFVVPTGNFGNILAGVYARAMGLPIGKLLCASNQNHILTDFIQTGVYDTNRPFYKTISPSMDILISSNLERYLFELSKRDASQVAGWMDQLKAKRRYEIREDQLLDMRALFHCGWADDTRTRDVIRAAWEQMRYLCDPHTALAISLLKNYRDETGDRTPSIVVSTASPFKFGRDVGAAILGEAAVANLDDFAACKALAKATGIPVPKQITELPDLPVRHTAVCAPDAMDAALLAALSKK